MSEPSSAPTPDTKTNSTAAKPTVEPQTSVPPGQPVVEVSPATKKPSHSLWPVWLILFIFIGLPLLYLGYRLVQGVIYSPERSYERNKTKVEAASKAAAQKVEVEQNRIEQELLKTAPTLKSGDIYLLNARDPQTGKLPSTVAKELIGQDAQGKLTRVDGEGVEDGCMAYTKMSGDKFNSHEVGRGANCTYGSVRLYLWTGSDERIRELQSQVNDTLDLKLDQYSNREEIGQKPVVTMRAQSLVYGVDSDDRTANSISRQTDWEKTFVHKTAPAIQSVPSDKRYYLRVLVTNRYYQLYDINY